MTIPRVLLALALLVIGGMLWGLHKDIMRSMDAVTERAATIAERIDAVNDHINKTGDKLMTAATKPPQVITKTEVQTQYKTKTRFKYRYLKAAPGQPKARKHRRGLIYPSDGRKTSYMRITQPEFRWDQLLVITPETPTIYSTPLPP